ncbi:MAG: apolipoprotein N-acyltransferase [Spirochaetaceae bacterium]|jgi:apolipoprotein N-acyltransferase|nr:apolipoprotein N-acyltransferase [Spirochaetaceae bacterium]
MSKRVFPTSKTAKDFAIKTSNDGAKQVPLPSFLTVFLKNAGLALLAAALFALAHPNPIFMNGLPALAWVMYLPVLVLIRRSSPPACLFWGALYGFAAFLLFNYWMGAYQFIAGVVVYTIYLCYFALLFLAMRIALVLFPRYGFILQWLIFAGFEYLRTLGFLGYPYGITGYTQWQMIPLIQVAGITGVWGVSALIIFPQTLLARYFYRFSPVKASGLRVRGFVVSFFLYLIVLALCLVYGFATPHDFSDAKTARIALIQHNTDPWKDDKAAYQNNFRILKRLSEEALAQSPRPELVVWSETAFVPMIYWHSHYRTDSDYYAQVKELLDFLARQDIPFVVGNDDGRREMTDSGAVGRVDYNAAILFERGEMVDVYRKIHLVPFTEHFPYKKQLPFVYKMLEDTDTHFWKKGTRRVVFDVNDLRFSTPICFEDTFGNLSREFVQNGAELIVNLSNDAWSHSLSAQMQHLSMAVFRSVENRRSMTRSTASGQTCAVAPDGKILAMADAFTETALTVSVPIITDQTFYTRHGDFLPRLFLAAALAMALAGIARAIYLANIISNPKSKNTL